MSQHNLANKVLGLLEEEEIMEPRHHIPAQARRVYVVVIPTNWIPPKYLSTGQWMNSGISSQWTIAQH